MTVRWRTMLGAGAVGVALAVAGCGNGAGTGSGGGTGAGASPGGSTVAARDVAGVGTALAGADGRTLYFADQETGGSIHCLGACLRFWVPLTVPAGTTPTAATGVTGTLGTLHRPDGSTQVTYDGRPLYTFVDDGGPGNAKGNGFQDSFGGTDFVWHAAAVSGAAPAPTGPASTGTGYGY